MRASQTLIALSGVLGLAQAGPCKPQRPSSVISTTIVVKSATSTASVPEPTIPAVETSTTEPASIETLSTDTESPSTTVAIETSATSATTDVSVPTPCAIEPGCEAAGFNVDYYKNVFERGYGNDEMSVPPSYYITDELTPLDSSVTSETYFAQDYMQDLDGYRQIFPDAGYAGKAWYIGYHRTLAGGIKVDGNNFTLVYTGYYKAPETGTYELCVTADNANTLYFGQGNAFECGTGETDPNAPALVLTATGYHFNNPTQCGNVDLIAGRHYPVRNVMGNKNAVSAFEFSVKTPSGKKTHDFSGQAFPVACGVKN
ncbi:GLEYA adhesin domain protein [Fusarium beomiforme]|uniref:GLEYA adhesin domain protein n=1 Tax=Fusarium beomiforme TaxID=44412 RepID=A0A9P5AAN1_9HYPO|nr:GLEYA adhesin domain protein [Fusarium beomiforme]